jgi:molecular chaperone DnaK (HSP70)
MAESLLVIDYGTASTVAMLQRPDGTIRPVVVEGAPVLPSPVCVGRDGSLVTGSDAMRYAQFDAGRFGVYPKRHVDDGSLAWAGPTVTVSALIGATLGRIRDEAVRVQGTPVDRVALTVPAGWAEPRRSVLRGAAVAAGLPVPDLISRPVATATYFTALLGHAVGDGQHVVTYHLGAGSFEAAVLRRAGDGFEILAARGDDAGGLDLDALLADRFSASLIAFPSPEWHSEPRDSRERWMLLDSARIVRETLSTRDVVEPITDGAAPVTRAALENLVTPLITRTAILTREAVGAAGVRVGDVAGWFMTGGVTATPLVAKLLHDVAGLPPVALRHPRRAAVEGAMHHAAVGPAPKADPDLIWFDSSRSYLTSGGHVSTEWYVSMSPPAEVIRWYRSRLGDHVEESAGRWARKDLSGSGRDFHHVTVIGVADLPSAGPRPSRPVPDHYRTIIRDDTALLP